MPEKRVRCTKVDPVVGPITHTVLFHADDVRKKKTIETAISHYHVSKELMERPTDRLMECFGKLVVEDDF